MRPPLSPTHGTSLGTTAGITAVISLVIALSLLGQTGRLSGADLVLAECGLAALLLGAGSLYAARNQLGQALDFAANNPSESTLAAARGLARFHCGMACVFAGCGFSALARLPRLRESPAIAITPAVAFVLSGMAFLHSAGWLKETAGRRRQCEEAERRPGALPIQAAVAANPARAPVSQTH